MENKILNMKITNFCPDSLDMTVFGKSPCQKVVKLHSCCRNAWNTCPKPKSLELYFRIARVMTFYKYRFHQKLIVWLPEAYQVRSVSLYHVEENSGVRTAVF